MLDDTSELRALLSLHALPGMGPQRLKNLLRGFGSARAAWEAPSAVWPLYGVPETLAQSRKEPDIDQRLESTWRWLENPQHHLLRLGEPDYPALLAELSDAPPVLFVAGDPARLEQPQVAIVGSRKASRAGLDNAQSFARALAEGGFTITSGLALGIDGAAHHGALHTGRTIAVLGSGLTRLYPPRHVDLAHAIVAQGGALVSEFPLDAAPLANHFPRRNRLISGLALGVLVVEAAPASGSLITARLAAEQGREVWAIPGSIHHPGSRGCHQLIREGAQLVECIEHILEGLQGWKGVPQLEPTEAADAHPLVELLRPAPMTSDTLAAASGRPLAEILADLTDLELSGCVERQGALWLACH